MLQRVQPEVGALRQLSRELAGVQPKDPASLFRLLRVAEATQSGLPPERAARTGPARRPPRPHRAQGSRAPPPSTPPRRYVQSASSAHPPDAPRSPQAAPPVPPPRCTPGGPLFW